MNPSYRLLPAAEDDDDPGLGVGGQGDTRASHVTAVVRDRSDFPPGIESQHLETARAEQAVECECAVGGDVRLVDIERIDFDIVLDPRGADPHAVEGRANAFVTDDSAHYAGSALQVEQDLLLTADHFDRVVRG